MCSRCASIFGIGRPLSSKIAPWLLTAAAYVPAVVQLGVASVSSGEIELIIPEEYYTYIQIVLALFVAVDRAGTRGARPALADALALLFARDRPRGLRACEVRARLYGPARR